MHTHIIVRWPSIRSNLHMYMHVCAYECMHSCLYICLYDFQPSSWPYVYVCICMSASKRACMCSNVHVCIHARMHVGNIFVCWKIGVCVGAHMDKKNIHVHMHIFCPYARVQTHTHQFSDFL